MPLAAVVVMPAMAKVNVNAAITPGRGADGTRIADRGRTDGAGPADRHPDLLVNRATAVVIPDEPGHIVASSIVVVSFGGGGCQGSKGKGDPGEGEEEFGFHGDGGLG